MSAQTHCMWQAITQALHISSYNPLTFFKANSKPIPELPADVKKEIILSLAHVLPAGQAIQAAHSLACVNKKWRHTLCNLDNHTLKHIAEKFNLSANLTAAYLCPQKNEAELLADCQLSKAAQDAYYLAYELKTNKSLRILASVQSKLYAYKKISLDNVLFLKNIVNAANIAWIYHDKSLLVARDYGFGSSSLLNLHKYNENSLPDSMFVSDYSFSPNSLEKNNQNNSFVGVVIRDLSMEHETEKPLLAMQNNANLIVLLTAGLRKKGIYLVRMLENGTVDESFGADGIVNTGYSWSPNNQQAPQLIKPDLLIDPQTSAIIVTYGTTNKKYSANGKEIGF